MENKEIVMSRSNGDLEFKLVQVFERVQSISDEMASAKELGDKAKEKAQAVQTGFFKSKNKALEDLKDASIMNSDASIATLELVDKISDNQQRMIEACNEFIKLGAVDIASNRAVVAFIERTMSGGAEKTLTEETKQKLIEVIHELKEKSDINEKQKRHARKINEHESRIRQMEVHADETDREIVISKSVDKRQDKVLSEQDSRLDQSERNDEQHDRLLLEQESKISELVDKVNSLEQEVNSLKGRGKNHLLTIASMILAVVGIVLGMIALIV